MNEFGTTAVIPIAEMNISAISDDELETAFLSVIDKHKETVLSIHKSMIEADETYRKYLGEGYEPAEDQAKTDRAALNKAEKNIAEQYKTLKTAYEKPLAGFEFNIKLIRKAIEKASDDVDAKVKKYEEKVKEKKRLEIQAYFDTKNFALVPLEKFFSYRWLNKTCKMPEIRKEIDDTISMIYVNIKTLEGITEYGPIAKALYLDTLDMGAAMRKVETLKANAELLAKEKIEREERERREQIASNAKEERAEEVAAKKEDKIKDLVDNALGFEEPEISKPEIMEFIASFKGAKDQLFILRDFMTKNGISYQKGLVLNDADEARYAAKEYNVAGKIYSFIYIPNVA
jgi:hypothetical protein